MPSSEGQATARLVLSESRRLRSVSLSVFYFVQGLPMGLFLTAITGWLAANGRSAGDIAAIVAMAFLPWSLKFVGAAFMDRFTFRPMGRRRPWLIVSQIMTLIGLATATLLAPTPADADILAWLSFAILLGGAIQDSAVDGLAVEIVPNEEQGTASAFMFGAQALGVACGSALGGQLLEGFGTATTFLAFMPFNVATFIFAISLRERRGERLLPWTEGQAANDDEDSASGGWIHMASTILVSVTKRESLILISASTLAFAAAGVMVAFWPSFAVNEAGYDASSYAKLIAAIGLGCSVACIVMASLMIGHMGAKYSSILAIAGYCVISLFILSNPHQAAYGAFFLFLAVGWKMAETLLAICTNPLRMRICDRRVAATQFTIYTSLANLAGALGAALFEVTAGGDGHVLLMTSVLGLALAAGCVLALLRIPAKADHEFELAPQYD